MMRERRGRTRGFASRLEPDAFDVQAFPFAVAADAAEFTFAFELVFIYGEGE